MRDPEALGEFLAESWELLDSLDRELVLLENDATNSKILNSVFRVMHTLKGNAGFLALGAIEGVAHVCESLLERARDGESRLDPSAFDLLFKAADQLRSHFLLLEKEGDEGHENEELIRELNRLFEDETSDLETLSEIESIRLFELESQPKPLPSPQDASAEQSQSQGVQPTAPSDPQALASEAEGLQEQYARVRVDLLDRLMNLMGEIVLCRNELLQASNRIQDTGLLRGAQRLDLLTAELQDSISRTRMQPLDRLTSRFPRLVRDLAKELGKEVTLRVVGQDTGLDRALLETIRDPLLHLIRNSVDHGIEPPTERVCIGKPSTGTLTISACHEGGLVKIEVSDDGRGVLPQKIRARAASLGLFSQEQLHRFSDSDVIRLIFEAGFSTADSVNTVSGRGVGMDVVRNDIEAIGGTVDISSECGRGTTVTLLIPLTLAIIPALMVELGSQTYAIPQINLQEIIHFSQERLESVHGTELYRYRGSLIPLVRLARLFGIPSDETDANVVVVLADGRPYGLLVEMSCDTAEIVVKPLPSELREMPYYSGTTIAEHGRVALILDTVGIARQEGLLLQEDRRRGRKLLESFEDEAAPKQTLLLFRLGDEETFGIPLSVVSRLEEFETSEFRTTAGNPSIEYRGKLLPLLCLSEAMGKEPKPKEVAQVLLFTDGDRRLGVMVETIVDIVEEAIEVDPQMGNLTGILGSAIVGERAVTVIDILGLLRRTHPQWLRRSVSRDTKARESTVLLAHDSDFFRAVTKSYLESEGYSVLEASRKDEAMDYLTREDIDSVVVDIDMHGSSDLLMFASGEHPAVGVKTSEWDPDESLPSGFPIVNSIDRESLIEALRLSRQKSEERLS